MIFNTVFKIKCKLYTACGLCPPPNENLWVRSWDQLQLDKTGYKGHKLPALPTTIHREVSLVHKRYAQIKP